MTDNFYVFLFKNKGMDYVIIALTVLFGAGLTFFSGFGLGTLMLPVFSLFFPLPVAIAATAIVHLSNNLFKFGMVYKHIHLQTLIRFGLPAVIFAAIGGLVLKFIGAIEPFYEYQLGQHNFQMSTMKIVIGSLMIFFAWFDLDPRFSDLKIDRKWIPLGGALSGFFGGVSGHQGAFRSAFLTKAGLTKEEFIGTSNSIALLIDLARLIVYYETFNFVALSNNKSLLIVGIVFAFVGTYFGKELVKKTTLKGIQRVVGVMLFLLGALFICGIL
jgi:uncharacterized membrane protein YfcA